MAQFFIEYHNHLAFIICGLLGGITHYLKKVATGQTDATFTEWFGRKNLAATLYTLIVFIFVIIGALAGGIINDKMDIWTVLYAGFFTGFAVDSGFNSDKSITRQLIDIKSDTRSLFNDDPLRGPIDDEFSVRKKPDAPKDEPVVDDDEFARRNHNIGT